MVRVDKFFGGCLSLLVSLKPNPSKLFGTFFHVAIIKQLIQQIWIQIMVAMRNNMRENVYREKKVRKVKSIPFPHSFHFPYLNNDFYPTIKFEMQKLFIYLLGQVSHVDFPLNCNCSSFMVWLKSFQTRIFYASCHFILGFLGLSFIV
jgi:hypothetical protein